PELRAAHGRPHPEGHRRVERRDDGSSFQRRVLAHRDPGDVTDQQEGGTTGAREVWPRLRDGHVSSGETRPPRADVSRPSGHHGRELTGPKPPQRPRPRTSTLGETISPRTI